jgi:two-component system cell cycle response regulator DivK
MPDNAPAPNAPLILVVDDYEDNRALYAEYLVFSGFRVEEACDGGEAIEKATSLVPDVIVMDLSLPVVDGWEATRRLRADARTRTIPIIALSGHSSQTHAQEAKAAGCNAYLSKPCLPDALLACVKKVLAG